MNNPNLILIRKHFINFVAGIYILFYDSSLVIAKKINDLIGKKFIFLDFINIMKNVNINYVKLRFFSFAFLTLFMFLKCITNVVSLNFINALIFYFGVVFNMFFTYFIFINNNETIQNISFLSFLKDKQEKCLETIKKSDVYNFIYKDKEN